MQTLAPKVGRHDHIHRRCRVRYDQLVLSPMYVQIYMTLKRRSHFAGLSDVMAAHKITAEPANMAIETSNLPLGSELYLLRPELRISCDHKGCYCPVMLGSQTIAALNKEKEERQDMGWSEAKMKRWLADVEKKRGYIYKSEDGRRWVGWIQDLLSTGFVDEVGLFMHATANEPKKGPPLPVAKSVTVPLAVLTLELLDAMEREVLYRFIP